MAQPLHLKNAYVWWRPGQSHLERVDLHATDVFHEDPVSGAATIDLDGYTVFPGLVNAHDHLDLNHYPRSKYREVYANAHEWGEDMDQRLDSPPFRDLRDYPIEDRLFIGGIKNLLSGATTVAHHNPPHPVLFGPEFPVRVLKNYGWAHSLHFNTELEVQTSYRKTPADMLWFIHLAEGRDRIAAGEYRQLKQLGCVGPNTVIIHGVGLQPDDTIDAFDKNHARLVWCPSTNLFLLGDTVLPQILHAASPTIALGSDSRLTADGDLLDEMRAAHGQGYTTDFVLLLVTLQAADLLGLQDVGTLEPGNHADFIAIRSAAANATDHEAALIQSGRADIALVVRGGLPRIGDPDLMKQFPHVHTVRATLDGRPKLIETGLARRILECALDEPGLTLESRVPAKRSTSLLPNLFGRRRN